MTISLNDYVTVRLTDKGIRVWHDYWEPYAMSFANKVDAEGNLRILLWQLMEIFGPHISMTAPQLFVSNTLKVEI